MNPHPHLTATSKCDQVIYEAMIKFLHVIICSRHPKEVIMSSYNSTWKGRHESTGSNAIHSVNVSNLNRSSKNSHHHHHHHHVVLSNQSNAVSNLRAFHLDGLDDVIVSDIRQMLLDEKFSDVMHSHKLQVNVFVTDGSNTDDDQRNEFEDFTGASSLLQNDDELLESWVIGFNAWNDSSNYPRENITDASDLLAALRRICKRVILALRIVHSFTRMMPMQKVVEGINHHGKLDGFYYAHGSSTYRQQENNMENTAIRVECSVFDHLDSHANEESFHNKPTFLHHHFQNIPTPFGDIRIKVFYSEDAGGRVPRILGMNTKVEIQDKICEQSSKASIKSLSTNSSSQVSKQSDHVNTNNTSVSHKGINERIENTKKAMSGLSLALMNECNVTHEAKDSNIIEHSNFHQIDSKIRTSSLGSSCEPTAHNFQNIHGRERGISISSTPPFGQSPCLANMPITISATPPFPTAPINMHQKESPMSQSSLLPPSSLERLPISPFEAYQANNGSNSMFAPSNPLTIPLPTGTNTDTGNLGNDIEPPFAGSFPSPSFGIDNFNDISSRSKYSLSITGTQATRQSQVEDADEDLPFAVNSSDPSSFSGDTSSNLFAQKYTVPQRLQLFDNNSKQISSGRQVSADSQVLDLNLDDQLEEFHTFSANLSQLIGSSSSP